MDNKIVVYFLDMYVGFFIYVTTTYMYFKVSINPINRIYHKKSFLITSCCIVSIIYAVLCPVNNAVAQTISYFSPSIVFSIFEKNQRREKFFICFILSSITRIIRLIPTAIVSVFLVIINPSSKLFFSLLAIYASTFVFAFLLLKIKRFKKGFQFLQNEKNLGLGLVAAGFIYSIEEFTYLYDYLNIEKVYEIIFLIGLFISGFGLYLWIRRSITAHYRERLQLKSEEHYQELLKEKELENEKLSQSNEFLAKVVHRDNHLMSALNNSINAYFDSNGKQLNDDLLREIQTLAKERGELIEKEQRDFKLLPTTGNLLIDGAVNDLYIKAAAHGIDFNLTVSETVDAIIGKYIPQIDLQTLLCDHIKDAIIAVDATENNKGKILVDFSMKNENYQITVFDSGVDFEIDTLSKLGKERVTTHADNGGSGIGFMTTFETLRKAYASLMITEFAHKTPFSKSVSIIFDGENSFIIQSYRSDILKTAINRDDMVII